MRHHFTLFVFAAFVCLLGGACQGNVADSTRNVSIGGIPSSIGTSWTYVVTDSLADRIDTVTIRVERTATLLGGVPAVVWSVKGGGRDQTKFVALLATGIRIQESSRNDFLSEDFVFPMTTGDSWQQLSATEFDSSVVPFLGAIGTRAATFQISARVNRNWGLAFSDTRWGKSETWIAENVGIVFRHLVEFSHILGPDNKQLIITNEVWSLLRFQVI